MKLDRGNFYRVGINSTSHQNFRSQEGKPVPPSAIYFATQGATEEIESRCRRPEIVKFEPANGAKDIDPSTEAIRVTFNIPMGPGFSWTESGSNYPKTPEGKTASWSDDGLTCTLPVLLEAGHHYELGFNSTMHINFQSKWGVPLEPVEYTFTTCPSKSGSAK